MSSSSTTKTKKKPGRPRKPVEEPENNNRILGIVTDKPQFVEGAIVELSYKTPILYKKLFNIMKNKGVTHIIISFKKDHVFFYANGADGKDYMTVRVNCHEVNSYYCEREYDTSVKCDELSDIFNAFDTKMSICIFHLMQSNFKNIVNVRVFRNRLNSWSNYELQTTELDSNIHTENIDDSNYPIKLQIACKEIKKIICDIEKQLGTDQIFLEKSGNDPLVIGATVPRIKHRQEFGTEPNNIKLESTIGPDNLFYIEFSKENVYPYVSADLSSNDVHISAKENEYIIMSTTADNNAFQVKMFTKL
jgi:hypothetical protein